MRGANTRATFRQALRYIIRNTLLPQRVRAQAQLELSQMHAYTRSTQFKNRCIMGGKGRGIMSDFRMGRVSPQSSIGAVPTPADAELYSSNSV